MQKLLASVGVDMQQRPGTERGNQAAKKEPPAARGAALGVRTGKEGGDVKLSQVFDGGAAQAAGLAAGDIVIAIDGLRVTPENFDAMLGRHRAGETVPVHAFRRDELHVLDVTLAAAKADDWTLTFNENQAAARARRRWLGTD